MTISDQTCPIEDVQNSPDLRSLDIDKVGIKSIRHPVLVKDKTGGAQHTVATFNMYVYLPHNFKGTHMSRFVEILNMNEREISVESFENILIYMIKRLEAKSCDVEMTFPYFINKTAPISGVKSLLDYDVSFIGKIAAREKSERANLCGNKSRRFSPRRIFPAPGQRPGF